MFRLYQKHLTDDQRIRLNGTGWSEEFAPYADLSSIWKACEAWERVRDAAEAGFFRHVANLSVVKAEDAFIEMNHPDSDWSRVEAVEGRRPYSLSVGDVLIGENNTEGWVCCSVGWAEMSGEEIARFLKIVEG